MYQVELYTDGACSRNGTETAVGGWCAILRHNGREKVLRGFESRTTNNRMELRAVIEGVRALKKPCDVQVYSDSEYVVLGAGRLKSWRKQSKAHANMDLWEELFSVGKSGGHHIHFNHVTGHSGHALNERCDTIAREQTK